MKKKLNRAPHASDEPLDRLFKLLPSESTAAFLLLRGYFPFDRGASGFTADTGIYFSLVSVIVFFTPFLLYKVWQITDLKVVFFITLSFVVWILNIDLERSVALGVELSVNEFFAWFKYILDEKTIKGMMVVWAIVLVPLVLPKAVIKNDD